MGTLHEEGLSTHWHDKKPVAPCTSKGLAGPRNNQNRARVMKFPLLIIVFSTPMAFPEGYLQSRTNCYEGISSSLTAFRTYKTGCFSRSITTFPDTFSPLPSTIKFIVGFSEYVLFIAITSPMLILLSFT